MHSPSSSIPALLALALVACTDRPDDGAAAGTGAGADAGDTNSDTGTSTDGGDDSGTSSDAGTGSDTDTDGGSDSGTTSGVDFDAGTLPSGWSQTSLEDVLPADTIQGIAAAGSGVLATVEEDDGTVTAWWTDGTAGNTHKLIEGLSYLTDEVQLGDDVYFITRDGAGTWLNHLDPDALEVTVLQELEHPEYHRWDLREGFDTVVALRIDESLLFSRIHGIAAGDTAFTDLGGDLYSRSAAYDWSGRLDGGWFVNDDWFADGATAWEPGGFSQAEALQHVGGRLFGTSDDAVVELRPDGTTRAIVVDIAFDLEGFYVLGDTLILGGISRDGNSRRRLYGYDLEGSEQPFGEDDWFYDDGDGIDFDDRVTFRAATYERNGSRLWAGGYDQGFDTSGMDDDPYGRELLPTDDFLYVVDDPDSGATVWATDGDGGLVEVGRLPSTDPFAVDTQLVGDSLFLRSSSGRVYRFAPDGS